MLIMMTACSVPIHLIGFIDATGEWVVEPVYYGSLPYSDDLFAVNLGGDIYGKWGYVNNQGQMVIDFKYDSVFSFYDGYAPVMIKEDKREDWFFIDKSGNKAFGDKTFVGALVFSEGLAPVQSSDIASYGKWGYINTEGEFVIEPQFGTAGVFHEGLAMVRIGAGESGICGYINKLGEIVIEPIYAYGGVFSEGLAPVKLTYNTDNLDWGYINTSGEVVIDFRYGYAKSFKEGLAPVVDGDPKTDLFSYIDTNGQTVLKAMYYDANPFYEGKAAIKRYPSDNTGWGYIDHEGELVIGGDYASCSDFKDGYAAVGLIVRKK